MSKSNEQEIQDAIRQLLKAEKDIMAGLVRKLVLALGIALSSVVRRTPVDLGQLRASNQFKVFEDKDGVHGVIFNTAAHAPYVHQGTGIYAADGKGRKTPWFWQAEAGKYKGGHFTVGQKPQPFMKEGVESVIPQIEGVLKKG